MRRIFLLVGLIVMVTAQARSQSFAPIPDSAVWTVTHCFLFSKLAYPLHKKFVTFGDTLIGGVNYARVYSIDYATTSSGNPDTLYLDSLQYEGALRESGGKVYIIPHTSASAETLYDFTGDVGDTISIVDYFGGPTASQGGYRYLKEMIASIDSVPIDGSYRRRYFFPASGYHPPEYWIEGIGSTFGLLWPFMDITDNVFALSCLTVGGVPLYYDSANAGSVCGDSVDPFCGDVIITGVRHEHQGTPVRFLLNQNYPNPFNPSTTISYDLPVAARVRLQVFDLLGRVVAVLEDGERLPGHHELSFEAKGLASGVYYYRLEAGAYSSTRELVILR
jgi:hypothetical protein